MEKIIIDGVCINNCKYCEIIPYDYPTSGIDIECYIDYQNEITKDCKENPNCLYKQLKRLEQENENLKEEYQQAHDDFITSDTCLRIANTEKDKLEHALEEIKKLTVIGINASQCNCGLRALADDILLIITEAIGE